MELPVHVKRVGIYLHIRMSVLVIYQEKRREEKIDKDFLKGEVLEIYHQ